MRGADKFLLGCCFAVLACYLMYDSGAAGSMRSGVVAQGLRQLIGNADSSTRGLMLLLCMPFLLGFFALLLDDHSRWAWTVAGIGGGLLVVEWLSRWSFFPNWDFSRVLGLLVAILTGFKY